MSMAVRKTERSPPAAPKMIAQNENGNNCLTRCVYAQQNAAKHAAAKPGMSLRRAAPVCRQLLQERR